MKIISTVYVGERESACKGCPRIRLYSQIFDLSNYRDFYDAVRDVVKHTRLRCIKYDGRRAILQDYHDKRSWRYLSCAL